MRHKHADLIRAWAEGAEIEVHVGNGWADANHPSWTPHLTYRIKPEPKPDIVEYFIAEPYTGSTTRNRSDNLRLTFDGETRKLKGAEIL